MDVGRSSGRVGTLDTATVVLCAALIVDTSLYSAIAPLLPGFADRFDASKTAIGILAAAYPAGIFVGGLISIRLTSRADMRSLTLGGLALSGASTLAFGFSDSLLTLDLTRFVQGLASGLIWSGALAWLLSLAPPSKRGSMLGLAMSAAIAGSVAGPAFGSIAAAIGTELLYGILALLIVSLVPALLRIPPPCRDRRPGAEGLGRVLRSPGVPLGLLLVIFPGALLGAVNALVPLRMDELGLGHAAIGLVFVVGAVVGIFVGPFAGALTDRRGVAAVLIVGMWSTALAFAAMAVADASAVLAAATVAAMGVTFVFAWVPSMALLSQRASHAGAEPILGAALINICISFGEGTGSPLSGVVAEVLDSDAAVLLAFGATSLAVAAVCGLLDRGGELVDGDGLIK